MSENKIWTGKWVKTKKGLEFKKASEEKLFQILRDGLREGQVVDVVIDFARDNGTLMQLAKLHAGIKLLAREVGATPKETKERIKEDAGLYDEIQKKHKSFADCSKEELADAINVMIDLGDQYGGINLR